jgi:hypothetical protein
MSGLRVSIALAVLVVATAAVLSAEDSSAAPPAQAPDIGAIVASVEQQSIEEHIDHLSNTIGPRSAFAQPEALQAAADYVEDELTALGYAVTLDPVTHEGATFPNVVGVHEGTTCPERVFVVGAHYDSVAATPGADDNASGVAGMLEIARALTDTSLPATVWFASFTMEENGLVGGVHMAVEEYGAGTPIVGMYSLEMLGYTTPEANFIAVIGNEASVRLVDAFERAAGSYVPELPYGAGAVPGNGETLPDVRRSDHAPFWDMGYQALMVTDTAGFRNPNYHQPTDTIDTLDMPFATNVTKAMLATTVEYLTHDGDGDGQPDACSGPLAATPTPLPTPTTTPLPTATATDVPPVGGIAELPKVGSLGAEAAGRAGRDYAAVIAMLGGLAAVASVFGGAVWVSRRRRRHL